MEIVLLRHGMPTVGLKGLFNAKELKKLVLDYEQSGIQDRAPQKLFELFDAHYVVCSHLNRSLQSAEEIGFKHVSHSDSVFSETNIPHFDNSVFKLPIGIWLLTLRIAWLFGFSKNGESFLQAKNRAEQAANKLIILAQEHEQVILVGHGLMNRLIAKELQLNAWAGPKSPGKKYWEFGRYKKLYE